MYVLEEHVEEERLKDGIFAFLQNLLVDSSILVSCGFPSNIQLANQNELPSSRSELVEILFQGHPSDDWSARLTYL